MTMPKIDPTNLEVAILQNRSWLAIWCGPRKRKMGHWFLYYKGKGLVLRATLHDATRETTLKELVPFGLPARVHRK